MEKHILKWLFIGLVPVPMALFGLLFVADGVHAFWTGRLLKRDLETANSVESGFVKLSGSAEARDEILTAPFSDRECLAYQASIQNVDNTNNASMSPNWSASHTVEDAPPFEIRDETGTVTVDLAEADWGLPNNLTHIVDSGDSPEGPYRAFVEDHDVYFCDDEGVAEAHKIRFVETRIEPGEELAVLGPADTDGVDRRIQPDGRLLFSRPFSIARSKASLEEQESDWGGLLLIAFGMVFVVSPIGFIWLIL